MSPVLPSQYQNAVQNDIFQQKRDIQSSQSDEKLNSPVIPFTGATKLISGQSYNFPSNANLVLSNNQIVYNNSRNKILFGSPLGKSSGQHDELVCSPVIPFHTTTKPSASFIGNSCNDGTLVLSTEQATQNNANNGILLGSLPVMKTTGEKMILHGIQIALLQFFLSNSEIFFQTVVASFTDILISIRLINSTNQSLLTHSFPMHPLSTPWKHQKTLRFSNVCRGWRKGALGTNGLNTYEINADQMLYYLRLRKIKIFLRDLVGARGLLLENNWPIV